MISSDPNLKKLKLILEKRSQEVLGKFRRVSVSNFSNKELIAILEDVNAYWKDFQRPALASFACQAVGGEPTMADDASLLIGLAAAGMGIHDDIIDKSINKHFRKTILGKYGLEKALLVGDLLIIKSLTTAQDYLEKRCSIEKKEAVFYAFRNFIFEIYEGEFMDIACRKNLNTNLEDYQKIIWKLASDGEACARIGAILGNGSENEVQALSDFGRRLGFQLILHEEMRDALNQEVNLPHRIEFESIPLPILYVAHSSENAKSKLKLLLKKPFTASNMFKIRKICWKTKAMNYVYGLAKKNARQAIRKLASLKPSPARDVLSLMMETHLASIKKIRDDEDRYA